MSQIQLSSLATESSKNTSTTTNTSCDYIHISDEIPYEMLLKAFSGNTEKLTHFLDENQNMKFVREYNWSNWSFILYKTKPITMELVSSHWYDTKYFEHSCTKTCSREELYLLYIWQIKKESLNNVVKKFSNNYKKHKMPFNYSSSKYYPKVYIMLIVINYSYIHL